MITLNLEQKLIKEQQKLVTPKELLDVKEYEKLGKVTDDDILSRCGLNSAAKLGKIVSNKTKRLIEETKEYNQDRVFHISQIESICNKYRLRFLKTKHYNGSVDIELPTKISNFEIAHNVRLSENNSFIVAPASSFKLQEKPKDPLLFYKINDDFYYLVHKWGNDLNIMRRFYPLLSSKLFTIFFIGVICPLPFFLLNMGGEEKIVYCVVSVILTIIFTIFGYSNGGALAYRLLKENNWNSKIK